MLKKKTYIVDKLITSEMIIPDGYDITYILLPTKNSNGNKPHSLTFNFEGENSRLNFFSFIIGSGNHTFNLETVSNHTVPHTNAYYHLRCILFDHAQTFYKGIINIEPEAVITDTYLSHHTLMLSPNTKATSIPSLEIKADDVKAGHAATIGKVDEEMMFYLQSRGLSKENAESLLIKAFIANDLNKIEDEKAREKVEKAISLALK